MDISVVDSGVGMSPEQVERLFQPFTKIMENRNLNRDGVGLGLSVSEKIAKALGGSIFVVSKIDHGSSFTLRLPLKRSSTSLLSGEEHKVEDSMDVLQGHDTLLIDVGIAHNRNHSLIGYSEACNFKASTRDMEYIPINEETVQQAQDMKPSLVSHSIKEYAYLSIPPQQAPNDVFPEQVRNQSVENQTIAQVEAPNKVSLNLNEAPARTMNMEIFRGGSQ